MPGFDGVRARLLEDGERLRQLRALQVHLGEDHRAFGLRGRIRHGQPGLALGLGRVAARQGHLRQEQVRVAGILGERALRARIRLIELAQLELHQAAGYRHRAGEPGRKPDGLLVGGRGLLVPAEARQRPRQLPLQIEGAAILLGQPLEGRQRFFVLALEPELARGPEGLVHLNVVLRVRPRVPVAGHRLRQVAERLQLLGHAGVHAARLRERGGVTVQLLLHRARGRRVGGDGVGGLAWIADDLVKLRLRAVDVVMTRVHERAQLAPAEMDSRVVRFAVDRLAAPAPRSIEKGLSLQGLRWPQLQERSDRRHDVDQADGPLHARAGLARARQLEEERHVEGLAVEEYAVLLLAMVAEPLAVVGDEEDDRAVIDTRAAELAEELSDHRVARRDLAVVGSAVAAAEGLGRLIRRVRLVDVQEQEERLRLDAVGPGEGAARRLEPGSLQRAEIPRPFHVPAHRVVERIEGVADAGRAAQDVGRHRGSGGVAVGAKHARQRRVTGAVEAIAEVAPHPVLGGQQPRQQGQVRRKRERTVAVGVVEQDRIALESVDVGRHDLGVTVGGEMIGAQRVDRDQDDGSARVRPRAAGDGERQGQQRKRGPHLGVSLLRAEVDSRA